MVLVLHTQRWTRVADYPRSMNEQGMGTDDVKGYALLLALAARQDVEPDEGARAAMGLEAFLGLLTAVERDAARRRACRDTDARAAVRVRPWALG